MRKIKYFILSFLLMTTIVQATTYENGETKGTKRWHVLSSFSAGTVSNVYDKNKSSHVISFQGEGTKSAYMLMTKEGTSWNNEKEHILHWQMKYHEDFVILVGVKTEKGKRYLIYTPGMKNGYMQYGLGVESTSGTWQRYTRNLEKDLERFENNNHIKSVETFVIRGNGSIDNIKMMKKHFTKKDMIKKEKKKTNQKKKPSKKKKTSKKKKVSKKKKPIKKKKIYKKKKVSKKKLSKKNREQNMKKKKILKKEKDNHTPVIHIQGDNPLLLEKGEKFVDPGVSATDKEDGSLSVTSREDIDIRKEGRYSVIYIATDSQGNSAVDTRYVEIGKGGVAVEEESRSTKKESVVEHEEEENKELITEEEDEIEFKLEERELEISEWEKELELREKEISQREEQIQSSMQE